jgi:carboxyl-terminal processing protease
MVENALNGMISSLDPHSSYFDPKTYADMQVKTEGQYGGLGLVIAADNGAIKVVSPMDDTPASKAGIKAGDIILAVDGKGLQGLSLDKVQELLRGAAGTKVTLTLMRGGDDKSFEVKLERAAIEVEAVKSHREGDIGYIRIPAFNEHTSEGLEAAVRSLKKQIGPKLKGYIVDLRDDGGGVLDQAIAVSDDFLDSGEIVSTRGRNPQDTERWDAKPGDIADGKPVIVLINGGTASASEIVAGALRDHKRAITLGITSFGKGSVQTIIPLNGGEDGALASDNGALLHALGRLDPGDGHRARYRGGRGRRGDRSAQSRGTVRGGSSAPSDRRGRQQAQYGRAHPSAAELEDRGLSAVLRARRDERKDQSRFLCAARPRELTKPIERSAARINAVVTMNCAM